MGDELQNLRKLYICHISSMKAPEGTSASEVPHRFSKSIIHSYLVHVYEVDEFVDCVIVNPSPESFHEKYVQP